MTRRGRGRPVTFDDAQRALYLDKVREGFPLADAATAAGITPQWANRVAAHDRDFDAARQLAKKEGKHVRDENVPHGEYRYNHLKCRCGICRTEASAARGERRHQEADDTASADQPHPPHVIDMRQHGPGVEEVGPPPLLARAS